MITIKNGNRAKNNVNGEKRIEDMRIEVQRLEKQIENLAFSIAESASACKSLVSIIEQLELQKDEYNSKLKMLTGL